MSTAVLATLAAAIASVAAAQVALWRRLRSLAMPRPAAAPPAPDHRPDPADPVLIAVPRISTSAATSRDASAELSRRFGPVWALADAGAPAEAIARETGHPVGQVELILNLRRRARDAGQPAHVPTSKPDHP